jgi:hypothetical protein
MKEEMLVLGQKEEMCYFIYGPQMEDVVTSYTDLTGKPITTFMGFGIPSMQVELLSEK